MLALIFTLLKIARLLQERLQSFWLESVTNFRKASLVRSTEEVDSLKMVSSPWVESLTRTTEGVLEFDCWIPLILLTRSRLETASLNTQSTRLRTASERRLMNSQNPTDEKMASGAQENSFYPLKNIQNGMNWSKDPWSRWGKGICENVRENNSLFAETQDLIRGIGKLKLYWSQWLQQGNLRVFLL